MANFARVALVFLVLACAPVRPPRPVVEAPGAAPSVSVAAAPARQSVFTMALGVGSWRGKPPMAQHFFDVGLHNRADAPRWMILQETFPNEGESEPPASDQIAELQFYKLSTQPLSVIAKGVGAHFWALRLPAGGHITLHRLPITSWWGEFPQATQLELIVATDIMVGGASLESRFQGPLLCETGADVEAPRDAADVRGEQFWHPPGGAPSAPIQILEESRERVDVVINPEPLDLAKTRDGSEELGGPGQPR